MIPFSDDNPTRTVPYVTLLLIGLCVAVFLWELSFENNSDAMLTTLGLTPDSLTHSGNAPGSNLPAWATVLTSMFLHGSVLHIAGNMLYLWIFGNNIEDADRKSVV